MQHHLRAIFSRTLLACQSDESAEAGRFGKATAGERYAAPTTAQCVHPRGAVDLLSQVRLTACRCARMRDYYERVSLPMNFEMQDPRHQNVSLDWSSVDSYMRDYAALLKKAIEGISVAAVEQICVKVAEASRSGNQIFVVGNGGSAAIAEHLCCDWSKGTNSANYPVISSRSLTSNGALYSAIANDYGFEHVFDTQLKFFARSGDVLIAISSSGNSANVLNAVEQAKALGLFVAGFSGFAGGKLAQIADASVYVSTHNYGLVEDAHQAVMHIIAQYIACRRDHGQPDLSS